MKTVCPLNAIFGGALGFALFCSVSPLAADLTWDDDVLIEGSATIEEWLEVQGEDGVLFKGDFGQGVIPAQNDGTRLMWYPGKAAFRAGRILDGFMGDGWNDGNIGDDSAAFGRNTEASGSGAIASGLFSKASGTRSVAMGMETLASGTGSVALGYTSAASGFGAIAAGDVAIGSGTASAAFNFDTNASGFGSAAFGEWTQASGHYSTSMGMSTEAQGYGQLVIGRHNVAQGSATSWVGTDDIFIIGNGTWSEASNAFSVKKNGDTTVGGDMEVAGTVRIEPAGDIGMGQFTNGPQ